MNAGVALASTDSMPRMDPGSVFRRDIQGLRGVAVLLVVGFHVNRWIPGGYVGVDVFFVISGLVITQHLRDRVQAVGRLPVGDFFARRVRRLLPMLTVTLSATALLGVLALSPLGASATTSKTAAAAALLNANTFLARQSNDYFALAPDANALLQTWSLSVEEQFYLVLPFVILGGAFVLARRRSRTPTVSISPRADPAVPVRAAVPTGLLAIVAAAAAASYALYSVLLRGGFSRLVSALGVSSPQALAFYAAPTRAWEFLAGCLLALSAPALRRLRPGQSSTAGVVGLIAILAAAALYGAKSWLSPVAMVLPVAGAALVLLPRPAQTDRSGPVDRLLSTRWLVAVGDVAYGWYLFHWPLIVFAAANTSATWAPAVAAALALALALGAKRVLEDPFRSDGRWRGRRAAVLAVTCVTITLVSAGVALVIDRAWPIGDLRATQAFHLPTVRGCNERFSSPGALDRPACTSRVPNARGRIVLIGDSHAEMWAEGVTRAGNELGFDVTTVTMSGCPMVFGILRRSDGIVDEPCRHFVEDSVARLRALRPDLVLLGAGSAGVLTEGGDAWRTPEGQWTTDINGKAAVWERGLAATTRGLSEAGIRPVLLEDIPYHPATNATCGRMRYLLSASSCASTRPQADVERERARSVKVDAAVADAVPGTGRIDPVPWLCPAQRCTTYEDGTWRYRDGDHLSRDGSEGLADRMRAALQVQMR